ncbi:MAG TPA: alpha/beta fold hydrolase [Terracidiphilus sp.]|jgi:pimeloyl-ACP methyl ester carboxylesterase
MKVIKRLLWVVAALLVVAGIGFWARPVSYYNGAMYLREFFSCVESSSVQVAGHRVHYLAQGPEGGPAVVLVHGLGGHAEEWLNLSAYLVKAGYRVFIPDLPGYGRSDKPADFSYSVRDEADVVVGFLDALGLKQVDLGGWSMGGGIAQHVAFRHPERVRKLMLFASIGLNKAPAFDLRLFTPTTPAELDQLDALLMPNPPKVPGFIARDILRLAKERAWVVHRALDSMRTGQDATDRLLPQLKMPVLIVWGDADRILPLDQGETMHKLVPQSELVVVPGCGHLAPAQCSSQIGPRVVEFVRK